MGLGSTHLPLARTLSAVLGPPRTTRGLLWQWVTSLWLYATFWRALSWLLQPHRPRFLEQKQKYSERQSTFTEPLLWASRWASRFRHTISFDPQCGMNTIISSNYRETEIQKLSNLPKVTQLVGVKRRVKTKYNSKPMHFTTQTCCYSSQRSCARSPSSQEERKKPHFPSQLTPLRSRRKLVSWKENNLGCCVWQGWFVLSFRWSGLQRVAQSPGFEKRKRKGIPNTHGDAIRLTRGEQTAVQQQRPYQWPSAVAVDRQKPKSVYISFYPPPLPMFPIKFWKANLHRERNTGKEMLGKGQK